MKPMSGECDIVTRADGMRISPRTVPKVAGMLAFQLRINPGLPGIKG